MFAKDGANMEEHVRKLQGIQQELNARGHYISNIAYIITRFLVCVYYSG